MDNFFSMVILFMFSRRCLAQFPTAAENVTEVLDHLLLNYRKELRPGFGGPPVIIETDLLIRSMGQISESDMDYSFQCYFRQRWFDSRLRFDIRNITEVTLNNLFLSHIWKPNTYFLNGQRSNQHNITVPNLFVRIREDGRVYLSRRLTIKAACPMRLNTYPMDRPVCPLYIGSCVFFMTGNELVWSKARPILCLCYNEGWMDKSVPRVTDKHDEAHGVITDSDPGDGFFYHRLKPRTSLSDGYTTSDVVYLWKNGTSKPVEVQEGLMMSQFDLTTVKTNNHTKRTTIGDFSLLEVYISFERHIGFFVLQTYLPCSMITCLSWVSFWINRDAAPARVLLGVTTILATAAIGMTVREGLPRVSYATALDMYLNVCVVYEMAAMIEYAAVNYFTKIMPLEGGQDEDEEDQNTLGNGSHNNGHEFNTTGNHVLYNHVTSKERRSRHLLMLFMRCLTGNMNYRSKHREKGNKEIGNSVSKIDIWSRYIFPPTFFLFNLVYWTWYLVFS